MMRGSRDLPELHASTMKALPTPFIGHDWEGSITLKDASLSMGQRPYQVLELGTLSLCGRCGCLSYY